jgi:hypothetical protein
LDEGHTARAPADRGGMTTLTDDTDVYAWTLAQVLAADFWPQA